MSAPPAIAAEELKTWQVLYPVYINVQKKVSEGRRVPRNKCCERPSIQEMAEVCRFLKLQVVLEVRAPRSFVRSCTCAVADEFNA